VELNIWRSGPELSGKSLTSAFVFFEQHSFFTPTSYRCTASPFAHLPSQPCDWCLRRCSHPASAGPWKGSRQAPASLSSPRQRRGSCPGPRRATPPFCRRRELPASIRQEPDGAQSPGEGLVLISWKPRAGLFTHRCWSNRRHVQRVANPSGTCLFLVEGRGEGLSLRDSWALRLRHFCRSLMLENLPRS